jgi:MFS family permease
LVLSGWDLAEFVKFLPGVSAIRELFYLPVWSASITLAILATHAHNVQKNQSTTVLDPPEKDQPTLPSAIQAGLMLAALGLMVALFPPYPDLLTGYQSAEFRWRFILGVSGILLVLLIWLLTSPLVPAVVRQRPGRQQATTPSRRSHKRGATRLIGGLLVTLMLVGAIPSLWHFLTLRSTIATVYQDNLGWGWGLGLFLVGWGLVGGTGIWLMIARPQREG